MKKILFIFIGCLFAIYSYSQSLYLDNGVSFSRLNNNYNKTLTTYRVEAGVNYLNRSLFFLSSGVGFQEMGGRFDYLQIEDQTNEINHTVNASVKYITINSLINFKYEKQNWMTYLGVGPCLYFNINDNDFRDYAKGDAVVVGLKGVVGVRYNLESFYIGANFNYNPCFSDPLDISGQINNYGLAFSLGYIL